MMRAQLKDEGTLRAAAFDIAGVTLVADLSGALFWEAQRLLVKHRVSLDRLAVQLLERETLSREELKELLGTIEPESRASETVGTVRAVEN